MITFGTGGFRAVIGDQFTKQNVQTIGMALSSILAEINGRETKPVIIGYDRRFLSKEAAQWLAEAFVTAGITVHFINYSCPTPLVMFTVGQEDSVLGCMITASHNPAIYNGVKLFTHGGRDADQSFTDIVAQKCRQVAWENDLPSLQDAKRSGLLRYIDPMNGYLDNIIQRIDITKIRDAHLHIAFDPMFGVATNAIQTILLTARCRVDLIHQQHDPLFGSELPAPDTLTMRQLQVMVTNGYYHYHLGIATDGDADRLGVVDEKGEYVDSHRILALVYYYLLKYKHMRGDVVRNVATSMMVDRIAEAYGEQSWEVPVGFKYVTAAMAAHDALVGGESSGGLTVRGYLQGKDSVFAASLLVEMLAVTGKPISQLVAEMEARFGKFYTEEEQIPIDAEQKTQFRQYLKKVRSLARIPGAIGVSMLDGQKVTFADGWCLVRLSGTEPLLRITAEGNTVAQAREYIQAVKKKMGL